MAETLKELFIIKATSKVTGNVHYVEIDSYEDTVSLVKHKSEATLYETRKAAEKRMKEFCAGEETHEYTVESVMMSLEEMMTMH